MKRPPAVLPESLAHRLNAYALAASAAGVSLLALAQPAEGKIVYTPAHRKIKTFRHYDFDLNHDGKTDFELNTWAAGHDSLIASILRSKDANKIIGVSFLNATYAAPLPVGYRVGPNTRFGNHSDMGYCQSGCEGPWFRKPTVAYLGLEFVVKGKTHYGWARIKTDLHKFPLEITGYAYETVPNKPIITGKTKGPDVVVSRQVTLGQLARGASANAQQQGK